MAEQEKQEKKEAQEAPLNFIGPLREDPERQRFVIKVYLIVFLQLLFTSLVTAYVVSSEVAKEWFRENYYYTYAAILFCLVLMCLLACCTSFVRKVPYNYVILALFTMGWTFMVAAFTQWFEPEDIAIAASLTTAMVLGLTIFACCCNMKLNFLWAIGAALSTAIWPLFFYMWLFPSKMLYNLIAIVVVILTSIYIVFDTKLIMKRLTVDEYIIGALLLYIDIIQLFMYILSLFGK